MIRLGQLPGAFLSNLKVVGGKPYSKLLIASDGAGWSLDEDSRELAGIASRLGIPTDAVQHPWPYLKQCVHYASHFSLEKPWAFSGNNRLSVDYYHGKPDQDPEFERVFKALSKNHSRMSRVRLSYTGMRDVILGTGIDPAKVKVIPIAVNPAFFSWQTPESKKAARERLGLPQSAVVIGSFQKDGVGWGEGMQPKLIKGPDVFVRTLKTMRPRIPGLMALLTGPARGYVKKELDRVGIPYLHARFDKYADIGPMYQALDAYVVSSREEGGPKAILESMVSGVPLVTTRVGQAMDLVEDGKNAFMTEVEDHEALAHGVERYLTDSYLRAKMLEKGRETAASQTYEAQTPLWRDYFRGFVD